MLGNEVNFISLISKSDLTNCQVSLQALSVLGVGIFRKKFAVKDANY